MASLAPIETYIAVMPIPKLGVDVYSNKRPLTLQAGRGSVFGGLLMAQSISAASATVSSEHYAYTQTSSFLRRFSASKVIYRVERVSDGRNYATRLVRAFEMSDNDTPKEDAIYLATISFQSQRPPAGTSLDYGCRPPDFDGVTPDDVPEAAGRELVDNNKSGSLQPFKPDDAPFDWRPASFTMEDTPSDCRTAGFSRSAPLANRSAAVNLAALAYMSDELLLGIVLFANPDAAGHRNKNVVLATTLNHHLWFHDPSIQVDEWMACERSTSWGADGRAIIDQKIWNYRTGRLILSCTQEALIRLRGSNL